MIDLSWIDPFSLMLGLLTGWFINTFAVSISTIWNNEREN